MKITQVLFASTAALFLLTVGGPAQARVFTMNGTFKSNCCEKLNGATGAIIRSFPFAQGGGISFMGVATATGTGTPTLTIGSNQIQGSGSFFTPDHPNPGFKTFSSTFSIHNANGQFKKGGGPAAAGTVGYCFNFAGNPNCTAASQATPPAPQYNGLLQAIPGPNKFGGVMQMLGQNPGFVKRTFGGTSAYLNVHFVAGFAHVGAPFNTLVVPTMNVAYATVNNVTTNTLSSTIVDGGMPWTTGMARAVVTAGGAVFPTQSATKTGSDNRTPLGAGNISLVSGRMDSVVGNFHSSQGITLSLTLSEKVPSLSLTGFAAAAGLMLLAVGYAFRRRFAA